MNIQVIFPYKITLRWKKQVHENTNNEIIWCLKGWLKIYGFILFLRASRTSQSLEIKEKILLVYHLTWMTDEETLLKVGAFSEGCPLQILLSRKFLNEEDGYPDSNFQKTFVHLNNTLNCVWKAFSKQCKSFCTVFHLIQIFCIM